MSDPPRDRRPRLEEREDGVADSPFAESLGEFDLENDPRHRFIRRRARRAQDSKGGLTQFFGGAALFGLGTYMLFARVMVSAGISGVSAFGMGFGSGPHLGMTLLPFVAGIVLLFMKGSNTLGWGLMGGGLLLLIVQIIASLQIHFLATPLPIVLFIVALMAAGLGLIARSLRGGDDGGDGRGD